MTTRKLNVTGLTKAVAADCVVQYYAPWCGYCKQLAPVYAQVANQAPSHVHMVRFNMDKHGAEVKSQNIGMKNLGTPVAQDVRGFPTVIMYKKDGTRSIYTGPRNADAMLQTIQAHYNAPSHVLRGGGGRPSPKPEVTPGEEWVQKDTFKIDYTERDPLSYRVGTKQRIGAGYIECTIEVYDNPLPLNCERIQTIRRELRHTITDEITETCECPAPVAYVRCTGKTWHDPNPETLIYGGLFDAVKVKKDEEDEDTKYILKTKNRQLQLTKVKELGTVSYTGSGLHQDKITEAMIEKGLAQDTSLEDDDDDRFEV